MTPWTVARQAPLTMEFSRQEYWSGLLCPLPGDLPDPGIDPWSPALQVDPLPSEPPGKPEEFLKEHKKTDKQGVWEIIWSGDLLFICTLSDAVWSFNLWYTCLTFKICNKLVMSRLDFLLHWSLKLLWDQPLKIILIPRVGFCWDILNCWGFGFFYKTVLQRKILNSLKAE